MGRSQDVAALIGTIATVTHLVADTAAIPRNTMHTKSTAEKLKPTVNVSIKGQTCRDYLLATETNATATREAIQADPPAPITILARGQTFTDRPHATRKTSSNMTTRLRPGMIAASKGG